MRYLKRLARRYPMQTFLFLFNAGVFTWLQTTGTMIANRLGLSGDGIWIYIPNWVKTLPVIPKRVLKPYTGPQVGVG